MRGIFIEVNGYCLSLRPFGTPQKATWNAAKNRAYFWVRVFMFLLSGLFCCLGFSGVIFFLFGRGRVSFFAVWEGARAPPKQQKKKKKKHAPAQTEKK